MPKYEALAPQRVGRVQGSLNELTLLERSVSPGTSTLYEGQTRQFTATVSNTSNIGVTWSISPSVGAISSNGLYTPPVTSSSQQTVTITATSQADTTKSASATVTLMPQILLTWPTPAPINSGTALSATQLNATASVPGTFYYTPAAGAVPAAGTATLSALFEPSDPTHYGSYYAVTVLLQVNGPAPIIITVAGNGTQGYSGDNVPATSTELWGPLGVTFDAAGNYYIVDDYNHRIRKVNPATGIITTVVGNGTWGYSGDGGPATSAAIYGNGGIAFDAAGNLYLADTGNNRIREVDALTGKISTIVGTGTAGYSGDGLQAISATLNNPSGVAVDAAGDLYISDNGNDVVREVSASTGLISTIAGNGTNYPGDGGPAIDAKFFQLQGLLLDSSGNLYIDDYGQVRMVTKSTGIINTVLASHGISGLVGDGGPAASASFGVWGFSIDAAGNFYFADGNNARVRKVTASTGIISTIAGNGIPAYAGDGGAATSAELSHPVDATLGPDGNVYISDNGANRIREIVFKAVVNWPTPAPIAYGTALSSTQLDATANVPGTFVYTPAAGTVLQPGIQTLSVTFTPTDTTDYSPVTATVQLVVQSATADSGTITLTVNGIVAATTDYGASSTPQSVAAGLVAGATSGSPVSLSYAGDALTMVSKAAGSETDYDYTLQTTAYNSANFSQPSFLNPPISGQLEGGANSNTVSGQSVYQYVIPSPGGYDADGDLIAYSDSVMGTWTFNYDTLNRLAGAQDSQPGNSFTNYCWSYDAFGNRTVQSPSTSAFQSGSGGSSPCSPANPPPFTFNTRNQISNGPIVPAYDAAGDLTNDGTNQYLYNADGKICAVEAPQYDGMAVMFGYIYDADGNRVAKGTITTLSCDPSVNGFNATANYVIDQAGNQMTEVDPDSNGSMAWAHTNVYANGTLMATYDSDGLHFYFNDWLGTRRAQTDYEGILEQTCTSLPFGDQLSCSQSTQYPTEQHFTGKERDSESGNDYFGARYFASTTGRFLSPDPQGNSYADFSNPQSWNMYAYVLNNPLEYTDPTGMYCDYSDHNDPQSGFDPSQFDYHSNFKECRKNGGQWVDDAYTHGGFDDAGRPDYAVSSNTQASNSPQPSSSDAWNDLGTSIPGFEDDLLNLTLGRMLPKSLGGNQNSFFSPDWYILFMTYYCGPGGAGPTAGAMNGACAVHDACYAAAPGGGIGPANNFNPFQPMTSAQAAQAKQCNQALYDAARSHPDVPGSKAVQWWTVNGSHFPGGGSYILYPGTEAVPW